MEKIGVVETTGQLFKAVELLLASKGLDMRCLRIEPGSRGLNGGGCFDAVIWIDGQPSNAAALRADVLIVAADAAENALKSVKADAMITVGFGSRDTITPSSTLLHEDGMATLQRELVRFDGSVVSPQEVPLDGLKGSMIEKMILAAVLLLKNKP